MIHYHKIMMVFGCALAKAVIRWLPTTEAWVRAQVRLCWIFGGRSGTGAGFLRVLQFSLAIFIPPIAPQSPSSVIWGWHNRPIVIAVPSGYNSDPTNNNNNNNVCKCQKLIFLYVYKLMMMIM
jgi:hypothetical protein